MAMKVLVTQSCSTLCDLMDCSLPRSYVHGVFQASIMEWVAISSSRGSSQPRNWTYLLHWQSDFLPLSYLGSLCFNYYCCKSLQSCPTLCDPIDGSPPGSSICGILQARTLEWVAISFSNAWKWKVKVKLLSRVRLLVTPWTAAHQAPLPMGFSRQEYWSGVPLPSPVSTTWAFKPTFTCLYLSLTVLWTLFDQGQCVIRLFSWNYGIGPGT